MKPTQGVILIMIAALLLYLTWSARSVLQAKPAAPKVGKTDPNIAGDVCPEGTKEYFVGATRFCVPIQHTTPAVAHTPDGIIRTA